MAATLLITPLHQLVPGPVTVQGWIEKIHSLKRHSFVVLRDGVGDEHRVQIYVAKSVFSDFVLDAFVQIVGTVKALPGTAYSFRPVEIEASTVTILGPSSSDIVGRCPPEAGIDIKLSQRHLYLRDPTFGRMTKLRAILMRALREHFEATGCTEITPPSFTGVQCEGGATLFHLKHPGTAGHEDVDCYLSQSGQFWLEFAAAGVGDCYCIAPSFRAEKSHTRRHLTEFTHAEAEWVGIVTLDQHLDKLRQLLIGTVTRFLDLGRSWLQEMGLIPHVETILKMCQEILILTHREAIVYCREHGIRKEDGTDFDWEDDIPEMQERQMIDEIGKIVFLVKFPTVQKSFYMQRDPEEPEYVWGCDVEVPTVGEVIGSGVRVYDEAELRARLLAQGLKEEDYAEYIDLRRFGARRTSGMGLGVDRLLTWLLDQHSIREVTTFPRYPGRLRP